MKTAIRDFEERTRTTTPDRRPFVRLDALPSAALPPSAEAGMHALETALGADVPVLVQVLVHHAVAARHGVGVRSEPPSVSALNRRRRAATQWLQAILAARVDAETLRAVGHALLPQLAGTGPDLHRGEQSGRDCVELLRGAATALIMAEPADNLVPHAKALHSLDTVLAIHLHAYLHAAAQSRAATV